MRPKILSPAGSWPMLKSAVDAGCDEVYVGVKGFNMRASAKNFELSELSKVVSFCHDNNVLVNLTLNIIFFDSELGKLKNILSEAKSAGIDAVICWDMAVLSEASGLGLPVHLSTQASVSNFEAIKMYHGLGVKRFILARELSLGDIKIIRKRVKEENLDIELETFCHGAMCVAVSGRCFLSQELFGKSANRGECIQPCRREYVVKDYEEGHELSLGKGYVMSPKDLCTIGFLDRLYDTVDVLKIEGRMRSPEYVSTVTQCYREALDLIENGRYDDKAKERLLGKLNNVYNRGFSTGFYLGKPVDAWCESYGSQAKDKKVFLGLVKNYYDNAKAAEINVQAAGFSVGDTLQFEGNSTGMFREEVSSIQVNNKPVEKAVKGRNVGLKVGHKVRKNDKVFRIVKIE